MKRRLTFLLTGLLALSAFAQESYNRNTFTASDGTQLNYRELTPQAKEKDEKYPLVLFMHGAGERGSDNNKQLFHGAAMFENPVNREAYPAYVIFPQCPENGYWAYHKRPDSFQPDSMPLLTAPTPLINGVRELLEQYRNRPDIDTDRIYIIGMSMGAMATYDLTGRYPEVFAAAIPICGTVNPKRLEKSEDVNFRIYHGDADDIVPVNGSRKAYLKLKEIGANVEYIEMPGINHGSWTPAFNQADFMQWLFSQRKSSDTNTNQLED